MKIIIGMFVLLSALTAVADTLWERNDKLECAQINKNVDEVKNDLNQKYGKDCDYLRDTTRIIIGNIFKCPDDKIFPYFRTKLHCELFFMEGKKDLVKFAPAGHLEAKKWVTVFGSCMEKASHKQLNQMGLQNLNLFCQCVAAKTSDQITGAIIHECSKSIK